MKQLVALFKKVDGKEILQRYWRAHVLVFVILEMLLMGFSRKSLEIVRLAADNRILAKLRKKYKTYIQGYLESENQELPKKRSDKVWILWMQGMEQAPAIVRSCYASLKANLIGKEIILLTEDNYRSYIEFPEHIQKKIDSGIITRTHMSDLLRLELLIKYGGTWIDATVFCSGNDYPGYLFESDLFVYQTLKPGLDGQAARISSWFMSACTNHPILCLTRALLYEYWGKNNKMVDYFLIHDFFELAIEAYPEEWKKVAPFSNSTPHILLLRLFEQYDEEMWEKIKSQTSFHKLTYKFSEEQKMFANTYYRHLFEEGASSET